MASKFSGVDFYDTDSLLQEEERAVRDTVRSWVDEKVIPVIGEHYVEGKFPKHLIPGMAELGLFGANLPEEYGCAGLNNVAYGLIMQELERGDSGLRSFASVQGALVMYPIYAFGSEEQKKEWLPKLASGAAIGCFGLTEPDFGSNPGGMITTAKETKDGWVLNGAKMWITNGSTAQVAIVWAKTGPLEDVNGIRGFIVPTKTKGFTAKDQKGQLSLRAARPPEGPRHDEPAAGGTREAQQRQHGDRHRARGAAAARRQRHPRRVPSDAPPRQPRIGVHLRRDPRHPHADPGAGDHGAECLQLKVSTVNLASGNSPCASRLGPDD